MASAGCYGDGLVKATLQASRNVGPAAPLVLDDGWKVTFDSFTVAFTDVTFHQGSGGYGYGLVPFHPEASPAWTIETAAGPGPWTIAENTTGGVLPGAVSVTVGRHPPTTPSLVIRGQASAAGVVKTFDWQLAPVITWEKCGTEQTVRGQARVIIDHQQLFGSHLDDLTGASGFGAYAEADANADGIITAVELAAVGIAQDTRFVTDARAPSLWSFLVQESRHLLTIAGAPCQAVTITP